MSDPQCSGTNLTLGSCFCFQIETMHMAEKIEKETFLFMFFMHIIPENFQHFPQTTIPALDFTVSKRQKVFTMNSIINGQSKVLK